ncbi:hypothetical protein SDC9_202340 [bioreactor metagenome]|uniref:Uncharacterized protein n=1 Tax=bioreactor metagenome TaxID=1076179 RepID=A0A645J5C3_9ZZZZ
MPIAFAKLDNVIFPAVTPLVSTNGNKSVDSGVIDVNPLSKEYKAAASAGDTPPEPLPFRIPGAVIFACLPSNVVCRFVTPEIVCV